MYRGLVVQRGPTDETIKDFLNKGIPFSSNPINKNFSSQAEQTNYYSTAQNGQLPAFHDISTVPAKTPELGPVTMSASGTTCPPNYTFALGYCVRNVNYYGCIPGSEYWDGSKCNRVWPKCGDGFTNDLNTGACISSCPPGYHYSNGSCTIDTTELNNKLNNILSAPVSNAVPSNPAANTLTSAINSLQSVSDSQNIQRTAYDKLPSEVTLASAYESCPANYRKTGADLHYCYKEDFNPSVQYTDATLSVDPNTASVAADPNTGNISIVSNTPSVPASLAAANPIATPTSSNTPFPTGFLNGNRIASLASIANPPSTSSNLGSATSLGSANPVSTSAASTIPNPIVSGHHIAVQNLKRR